MSAPGVPKGVPPIVAYWPIAHVRAAAWDVVGQFVDQLGLRVLEEAVQPMPAQPYLFQAIIVGEIADGSRFAIGYEWTLEMAHDAHLEMWMEACDRRRAYHDWSN